MARLLCNLNSSPSTHAYTPSEDEEEENEINSSGNSSVFCNFSEFMQVVNLVQYSTVSKLPILCNLFTAEKHLFTWLIFMS